MESKRNVSRKSKKNNNKMKGGQFIPTYTETSPSWHNECSKPPYAVDLNAGINEYMFSRPTPDNKFVVSTGLINNQSGVEMIGGKKRKSASKKKATSKSKEDKKSKKDKKSKEVKNKSESKKTIFDKIKSFFS